ncbi:MAG: hypothetical protein JO321_17420 [Solirubrobacterales bacterium]|nr:hypothetical protein [Solirubrobacterales bacterium]MBV9537181.1 hypothetical protein [Solirubrobacterales bacterium]
MPTTYAHVIWFVFENRDASQIYGNPSGKTPYMDALAHQCGWAANMHAEFHPSAPNYIAMTSGGNQGITSDINPSHSLTANNIFNQVQTAGMTWHQFSSRMPDKAQGGGNCWTKNYPPAPNSYYTAHHEPAPYYSDIYSNPSGQDCLHWDTPLDPGETGPLCQSRSVTGCPDTQNTTPGTLAEDLDANAVPNFVFIGPADDGGNSMLGGEVDPTIGDQFLQRWMVKITSSAAYTSGQTAIFITWDENANKASATTPTIPTILVAPSIPAGTVSNTSFNHYSMLKTTEEMLGISTYLGAAATATDMRAAFHW